MITVRKYDDFVRGMAAGLRVLQDELDQGADLKDVNERLIEYGWSIMEMGFKFKGQEETGWGDTLKRTSR